MGETCLVGACAVRCGDGIVGSGETCDDGNTANGDGCSAACAVETRCSALSSSVAGGFAEVPDAVPLRLSSTSFTIEMWANATTFTSVPLCNHVLATKRGLALNSGWFLAVRSCGAPGPLLFQVSGGGDPSVTSTVDVPTGRWFHVAVTFDQATSRTTLWLDGANVGSAILRAPSATSTAPLQFGQDTGGSDYPWVGHIDDVRISTSVRYTSAFTPAAPLTRDGATLALWDFNETTGSAIDASGNGYNATLRAPATRTAICPRRP
jgi:cysteine-rich repeat protein